MKILQDYPLIATHAILRSTILLPLRNALFSMTDIARNVTGLTWSKDIWDWVDSDFQAQINAHQSEELEKNEFVDLTNLFSEILLEGSGSTARQVAKGGYILKIKSEVSIELVYEADFEKIDNTDDKNWELTPLGAIIFLKIIF